MPPTYPKDRFDHLPHSLDRVGAHRAPGKKGRHWVAFWWALGATAVLIGLGVFGMASLSNKLNIAIPGLSSSSATDTATDAATAVPTAVATVDPSLTVTVLNGTKGTGVAKAAGEALSAAGWTVGALSNASTEDVTKTTVYYADATLEGAARGVAASFPGSTVLLASDFATSGADLTVVVGADFVSSTTPAS
ncbi:MULTISPECIES: LytR C-terminal domain-containing protein [unclassified Cryobacterium]|uniref:LytR C-terminal domain-containing protein n=1 Tax=unclassified Cryobacterium TaxID=2649013 RepID=UPI002AB4B0D1|nr:MULTISPECIES: LytR C-terminal domain-containing protein [unclassified Cryobacterium]MDY7528930.1 LytR C-terminal domain-containing protein [Cryobacterium sp. 10C2]MDY7558902.1 LytR C-terminal domain-containing protein [Cryobacterium sp. 10C3]MEB0200739.1 LytR C-terminal domain-containing protein [Cryobacterium sp. 5I3]MEB0286742.1 LytR C-terminal domain-containing protein [Cryobacterium sp. 10S3]MEB0291397.1 LytR C-terminal domain-containing protein [Cryobacterium sp. 10C2]